MKTDEQRALVSDLRAALDALLTAEAVLLTARQEWREELAELEADRLRALSNLDYLGAKARTLGALSHLEER